ncbi:MAG: class I SAM-dependent methyltransferase [Clostridia bacterium]|nr:class I SAM-dependent methyltransferase [Clostridia bacterium]
MKADYKNWMPKGMIYSFAAGTAAACLLLLLTGCTGILSPGTVKTVLIVLFAILALVLLGMSIWSILMYRSFDYNGKRQLSRQIIDYIAGYVKLTKGCRILDVGCGSGALAIAVAKGNRDSTVTGIDRWGKEYASFNKNLCERNAQAEGVQNVHFQQGDATHLEFPDESFDAVTSNYVYHNIPSNDRQAILLETLRTLKKGGTFAIHDIFSVSKYGDMQSFVKKLQNMGYQKVELIDTTNGTPIRKSEAGWMGLSGSALLTGIK